jgi:hypothetical protein
MLWNSLAARIDSCAPAHSTSRFSHLCRAPPGGSIRSLLPSQFYLLCRSAPSSSIVLFRSNHETFNGLALDESIHNLRDIRDRDAFVKEVIRFD